MKKIYLLLVLAILVGGCTKVPKEYHQSKEYTFPKIGSTNTVEIGENLFSKTSSIGKKIIVQGNKVHADDRDFIFNNNKLRITEEGFNAICYSWFCAVDTKNDGFLDSWWNARIEKNILPLSKKVSYRLEDIKSPDYFKKTSLYQGKVNNEIKISYREFFGNVARPAFTQDVKYELNSDGSAILGFKGLRIKVLNATNTEITYKVLNDYK